MYKLPYSRLAIYRSRKAANWIFAPALRGQTVASHFMFPANADRGRKRESNGTRVIRGTKDGTSLRVLLAVAI